MLEVTELLYRAAEVIEHDGWWDGDTTASRHPKQCLMTALDAVMDHTGTSFEILEGAVARIRRVVKTNDIIEWNDAQRNGKVVIAALREAARNA